MRRTLPLALVAVVAGLFLAGRVARGVGREWLRPCFGAAVAAFERHARSTGPLLVGLATAQPAGPMAPAHWGAGFASVALLAGAALAPLAHPGVRERLRRAAVRPE